MDIKEFSSRLGISPATISQALNGKRPVKASTRKLVLSKMVEWGYTPNINARRLVTSQTNLIAFYQFSSNKATPFEDPYQIAVLRYLGLELRQHGYDLLLDFSPKEGNARYDALQRRVMSNAIDGSIVISGNLGLPDKAMIPLSSEHSPCVRIDNHFHAPQPHVGCVNVSSENAYREIFTQLASVGRTRVMYLGRDREDYLIDYCSKLAEELGFPPIEVVYTEEDAEDVEHLMRTIFARPADRRPQAILARTDPQGQGAYLAARAAHIPVPGELSIVVHSDSRQDGFKPVLANIIFDYAAMCRIAFAELLALRENPEQLRPNQILPEHFSHNETFL